MVRGSLTDCGFVVVPVCGVWMQGPVTCFLCVLYR